MIYTGEWIVTTEAAEVLRRVAEWAAARGSRFAGVEDLAAILQDAVVGQAGCGKLLPAWMALHHTPPWRSSNS